MQKVATRQPCVAVSIVPSRWFGLLLITRYCYVNNTLCCYLIQVQIISTYVVVVLSLHDMILLVCFCLTLSRLNNKFADRRCIILLWAVVRATPILCNFTTVPTKPLTCHDINTNIRPTAASSTHVMKLVSPILSRHVLIACVQRVQRYVGHVYFYVRQLCLST